MVIDQRYTLIAQALLQRADDGIATDGHAGQGHCLVGI